MCGCVGVCGRTRKSCSPDCNRLAEEERPSGPIQRFAHGRSRSTFSFPFPSAGTPSCRISRSCDYSWLNESPVANQRGERRRWGGGEQDAIIVAMDARKESVNGSEESIVERNMGSRRHERLRPRNRKRIRIQCSRLIVAGGLRVSSPSNGITSRRLQILQVGEFYYPRHMTRWNTRRMHSIVTIVPTPQQELPTFAAQ